MPHTHTNTEAEGLDPTAIPHAIHDDEQPETDTVETVDEGDQSEDGNESDGQEDAGTESRGGRGRRRRRPSALLRDRGLNYVNRMRNVGWLAGYALPGDGQAFLLQQTNNIEHALRVEVGPQHSKLSRLPGRPMLVKVHARGYRDEHGQQLSLHCIEMNKPSLLDLPVEEVWASGFGHGKEAAKILSKLARSNFSPFDADGNVRPEYRKHIVSANSETGEFELSARAKSFIRAQNVLGEILDASGGVVDSRLGRGQNYLSVAGFVDARAWIPATEHRAEYALLLIRQHEDSAQDIPVRVVGKMARAYYKEAKEGHPVLVEGSVRRKVIPQDEDPTQIKSRHTYLEATRVSLAVKGTDMLEPIPEWWMQIRDRLLARKQEAATRRAETQAADAAAKIAMLESLGDAV